MIFKDCLESDQILESDLLQVAVTKSIELFKSVTPSSLGAVIADSQSVKEEQDTVIDRGSIAGGPHLSGKKLRRVYRLR